MYTEKQITIMSARTVGDVLNKRECDVVSGLMEAFEPVVIRRTKDIVAEMDDAESNPHEDWLQQNCERCDGFGSYEVGEHDDITTRKCACRKQDDMDDDS